jgi:hypothetical protein
MFQIIEQKIQLCLEWIQIESINLLGFYVCCSCIHDAIQYQ